VTAMTSFRAAIRGSARRFGWIAGLAALTLLVPGTAGAMTITGQAAVTKPYSFSLEGYDVYLLGVDSVEAKQGCTVSGRVWECWAAAQRQLETILSEGEVSCESVVDVPSPNRMIALCTLNGEDVGQRFVASGFGLALPKETTRYGDAQADARVSGIGLWQGVFTQPSVWRELPIHLQSDRPEFTGPPVD
jgi:endonuclease YncB( thermonuclease family)